MGRIAYLLLALLISSCKAATPELTDLFKDQEAVGPGGVAGSTPNASITAGANSLSQGATNSGTMIIKGRVTYAPGNDSGVTPLPASNYKVRARVQF